MKKSLIAVAVLGAFAGSAVAAEVQLYGVVDEGLAYERFDADIDGVDTDNSFQMKPGIQRGSRWGLKGSEKVADDLTVSFILESGFNTDTGDSRTSGSTFDREASLNLSGSWGKFSAGKIGSINQGVSSWGKIGRVTPFGTSFGNYVAQAGAIFAKGTVMNNTIAYETPKFAGFQVFAQYSFSTTDDGSNENTSKVDRYGAIGATYTNGPLDLYLAVDYTNYQSVDSSGNITDPDDAYSITFGGSYNFEVAKIYAGVQYFDNTKLSSVGTLNNVLKSAGVSASSVQIEGWAATLAVSAPVAGGTAMFGLGYIDAESCKDKVSFTYGNNNIVLDEGVDITRWMISAGYTYPFSKRTNLYAVASYVEDKYEISNYSGDWKPNAMTVAVGLSHRF